MLVLSRKKNESIIINDDITVTIVEILEDKVRVGLVVPKDIPVHRLEVEDALGKPAHPNGTTLSTLPATRDYDQLQKQLAAAQKQIKQYKQMLQQFIGEEWKQVSHTDLEKALENGSDLESILAELEQGSHP